MEKDRFIETGRVTAPHGIRGDVKVEPWADSPEFLLGFDVFYVDGNPLPVKSARVHGKFVLVSFEGVDTVEKADALRNKTVYIDRADADLPEGKYFVSDLMGMEAVDEKGEKLGTVTDILDLPSGSVAEIKGAREILVPVRPEFVVSADLDNNTLTLRLIEGM